MAASTGLMLAVGGIAGGNEFLHGNTGSALKIGVATLAGVALLAGIEQIPGGQPFAVGLATIALIAVTLGGVTPGVPAPAIQILQFLGLTSADTTSK